jgi:ABC-type multidrug transport system fused ATPase/permease subunit
MKFAQFVLIIYFGFVVAITGCFDFHLPASKPSATPSATAVGAGGIVSAIQGANPVTVAELNNLVNTLKATLAKAQADMDKTIGEAKAKYAAQRNETEPKLAAAEKNLAAAETARTQWWMRFTAWALLFAGVVLLAISFWGKVPVFKGLLRAASGVLASLWLTLLLTAAVWPYMGWILAGLAVCACIVGLVYAIRHHDELFEAFRITSKVADRVPQTEKEAAFMYELGLSPLLNRGDLKTLRNQARPELLPPCELNTTKKG